MEGSSLRHLACVADGLAGAGSAATGVAAAFSGAGPLAAAAFASRTDLAAFTFFSPEVRDWVLAGDPAAVASFRLLGRIDRLPPVLRAAIPDSADAPVVGWFLDYSSREEILRAAGRVDPGAETSESRFSSLLDTAGLPDPDLVLLVGGAFEPKDFLLWQASYAELWHTPRAWSSFTPADLRVALADFGSRQRRFGG